MSTATRDALQVRLVAVYCKASDRLCAEDVPSSLDALVVERCTCPRADSDCAGKPKVVVVGQPDGNVRDMLERHGGCVEARSDRLLAGPGLAGAIEKGGLYMALSTDSGYALEPAREFAAALAAKLFLSQERKETVETALGEAVANAFVHGNLGLGSGGREQIETLADYDQDIERRLADPALGARRLEVSAVWDDDRLTLTVADEGEGYDTAAPHRPLWPFAHSGRGLTIIRALAEDVVVENEGRRLCMIFSR